MVETVGMVLVEVLLTEVLVVVAVEDVFFTGVGLAAVELFLVAGVVFFCVEVRVVFFVFWEVLVGDWDNSEVAPAVVSDEVVMPVPVFFALQEEKQRTVVRHIKKSKHFFIQSPQ